jgi:hypothetical protein
MVTWRSSYSQSLDWRVRGSNLLPHFRILTTMLLAVIRFLGSTTYMLVRLFAGE